MTSPKELFFEELKRLFHTQLVPPSLKSFRELAWKSFVSKGLPDRSFETYQYLKLPLLYQKAFSLKEEPELDFSFEPLSSQYAALQDGALKEYQAPFEVIPFSKAIVSYGVIIEALLRRWIREEKDPFALLNDALSQRGLFIFIPPGYESKEPFHLHLEYPFQKMSMPTLFFHVSKGAHLSLITTVKAHDGFVNEKTFISLEEDSTLSHQEFTHPSKAWLMRTFRGQLKRNSAYHYTQFDFGMKVHKRDFHFKLQEEGAHISLESGSFLSDSLESHAHVLLEHVAPHCTSNQLFKSLLLDESESVFEGKIYVQPQAQKTQAYQLNQNLILSDKAKAKSKPNLEIFADDVKASHGATMGQLSKEHLFYFRSRGLTETQAKELLMKAFMEQILEKLDDTLKEKIGAYERLSV